jgi:hypothetical protein
MELAKQMRESQVPGVRAMLLVVAIALVSGCAHTGAYDASYLAAARKPADQIVDGKVLIVTSQEDDQYLFNGHPTSFTGSATTLSLPLGQIVKEAAKAAFGDRFKDGADTATTVQSTEGYRVVVAPKVNNFSYAYNQLKNLGFAITPTVEASAHVRVLNPDGSVKTEKEYASGPVEAPSYMLSTKPSDTITKLTHRVVYELMVKAADDVMPLLGPVAHR